MKLTLRDYQEDALARVERAEAKGSRRQLGVAATGLGKTVIFCAAAERRGGRTLILAHRDELIEQAAAKVREMWPGADVGVVKAERNEVRAQVVVASVQTLARPKRLAQLVAPFDSDYGVILGRADPFRTVVVDEAHHTAADSYRTILAAVHAGEPDGPLLLGVTATPDRGDGKGLDDLFDEITFNYDILWGIRAGYLSDLRAKRITVEDLDLSGVKVRKGDYEAGAAGRAMEDAQAERHVVSAWLEHALGRRTLVFTPTVETARLVAEEFQHVGVKAEYVHGATPRDERRRTLADYSAGRLDVVVNCAVLTEGYDEPRTDCIVVARPTKNRALYTQMVGRGTRRHPDKADCLVLDIVGASDTLSLVTVPSLFGLPEQYAERLDFEPVAQLMQAWDDDEVKAGRLRAADAELFRKVRSEGLAWVATHDDGATRKRYTLGLGPTLPTVVLAQMADDDVWGVGLRAPASEGGGFRRLIVEVPLELAQGVGEDFARKQAPTALRLVDQAAPWRQRPPSAKQKAMAKRLGITVAKEQTSGDVSDAIARKMEQKKAPAQ